MSQELIDALRDHTRWLAKKGGRRLDRPWADFSGIRFQNCNLREARLPGACFDHADFSVTDFSGADLFTAKFEGATLFQANFRKSDLRGASFRNAMLAEADFTGADLTGGVLLDGRGTGEDGEMTGYGSREGVDMRQADLSDARGTASNFAGALLAGAVLRGTDLSGANLRGADLTGADLAGANLTGADLRAAVLTAADMTDAVLLDANLAHATGRPENGNASREQSADIRQLIARHRTWVATMGARGARADFTNQDLRAFNLSHLDLSAATFKGANLAKISLRGGIFRLCDFTEADLTGADLVNAVLQGTAFKQAKLAGADLTGADASPAPLLDYDNKPTGRTWSTNFLNADLTDVKLSGAKLDGANLIGAILTGVDLAKASTAGILGEAPSAG